MVTDGGNVRNVYLGQRPDGPFQAEVTVKNSTMTVKINCQTLMNDDVSYWAPYDNYFKAGGTFSMWVAPAVLRSSFGRELRTSARSLTVPGLLYPLLPHWLVPIVSHAAAWLHLMSRSVHSSV